MRTHGGLTHSLTEGSLRAPIGKGREGNRKGSGKENTEFSTHPQSPPANRGDASAAPRPEVSR